MMDAPAPQPLLKTRSPTPRMAAPLPLLLLGPVAQQVPQGPFPEATQCELSERRPPKPVRSEDPWLGVWVCVCVCVCTQYSRRLFQDKV